MTRTLPWIGLTVRLGAASIWLVAGTAKLADLEGFHAQVEAYKLLPAGLEALFAYALPFVEVGIGVYLALGLLIRPTAILACALMLAFVAAMAQARARGLSLDCGCFGSLEKTPVGLDTILRDALLGLPSLAMAIWPARLLSLDHALLKQPDRFGALRPGRGLALRSRAVR